MRVDMVERFLFHDRCPPGLLRHDIQNYPSVSAFCGLVEVGSRKRRKIDSETRVGSVGRGCGMGGMGVQWFDPIAPIAESGGKWNFIVWVKIGVPFIVYVCDCFTSH